MASGSLPQESPSGECAAEAAAAGLHEVVQVEVARDERGGLAVRLVQGQRLIPMIRLSTMIRFGEFLLSHRAGGWKIRLDLGIKVFFGVALTGLKTERSVSPQ